MIKTVTVVQNNPHEEDRETPLSRYGGQIMNTNYAPATREVEHSSDSRTDGVTNPDSPDHLPESLATSSSEEAPGLDEIFDLLKNYRRRCVLHYLSTVESRASMSDLAEHISGWENDKEPRLITSSERKRVYVGLYQSHLPKMDARGAIGFNKPRGIVEKGPYFDHFQYYLPPRRESSESRIQELPGEIVDRLSDIVG